MNRQERRFAERQAKKSSKAMPTCELPGAMFVVTAARDLKTGETRLQAMPNLSPLIDMFALMGDASVCEFKVREYIARNDDLSPMEARHFTNWCLGVQNSKSATDIEVLVAGVASVEEAHIVVNALKKRFA